MVLCTWEPNITKQLAWKCRPDLWIFLYDGRVSKSSSTLHQAWIWLDHDWVGSTNQPTSFLNLWRVYHFGRGCPRFWEHFAVFENSSNSVRELLNKSWGSCARCWLLYERSNYAVEIPSIAQIPSQLYLDWCKKEIISGVHSSIHLSIYPSFHPSVRSLEAGLLKLITISTGKISRSFQFLFIILSSKSLAMYVLN